MMHGVCPSREASVLARRRSGGSSTEWPGRASMAAPDPQPDPTAMWYALDDSQQYQGPYTAQELRHHYAAGYLSASTLLWADGQCEWRPLSSIPELNPTLVAHNPPPGSKGMVPPRPEHGLDRHNSDAENDAFKRFQEEIQQAEAQADNAIGPHDEERPHTPPEGEEEFCDDDGTFYRWDHRLKFWVPQDEPVPGVPYYGAEEMTYVEEEEIIPTLNASLAEASTQQVEATDCTKVGEKRKSNGSEQSPAVKEETQKKVSSNEPEGWFELKVNTHVYVTGLPLDVTVDEVAEAFMKCGVIKEDPETKQLRIKLYMDKERGMLKGDGLVTYLKEPSVDLAIKILDGTPLRPGDKQLMSVSQAKFQQKGDVFIKKQQDKQKKKKMKRAEQKALGWGGFDDVKKKEPITIALKNMFTKGEIESDPNYLRELEADVTEECVKFGQIQRLRVYDNSPQGIVVVKFNDREAGLNCIQKMNGRWFAGRQVEAVEDNDIIKHVHVWDATEEEARLEKFGAELDDD